MENFKAIPLHERKICIFADIPTQEKLKNKDWLELVFSYYMSGDLINLGFNLYKNRKNLSSFYKKHLNSLYSKKSPYPILNIDEARSQFRFQLSHPINGMAYATSELEDDLYIPLSSFHKFMYESKISAFTELCSSLGAKNCKIIYAEENGIDITAKVKSQNIPTNVGIIDSETNFNHHSRNTQNLDIFMSFPKNKTIHKYESAWMNGEPTWNTLQKIRLEKDVEKYVAEFNYIDDMGITANIANSLNNIGIDIGGKFEEFKKIKYKFEVEFWPKE